MTDTLRAAQAHCQSLQDAVAHLRDNGLEQITAWGRHLAATLPVGGRLIAAGNGGSAAQAQHLTAELVGRYRRERPAYSAIALPADTSSLTAIGNDYGFEELYARQVAAHGRPGDVLVLMSTSGRSPNLLAAADTGRAAGLRVWAMTGPRPNPLTLRAHDTLCIASGTTATVQEAHLVALHLLCETFDHETLDHDHETLDHAHDLLGHETLTTGTADHEILDHGHETLTTDTADLVTTRRHDLPRAQPHAPRPSRATDRRCP